MENTEKVRRGELSWQTARIKIGMPNNLNQGFFMGDFDIHNILGCLIVQNSLYLQLGKFKFVLVQFSEVNGQNFACSYPYSIWEYFRNTHTTARN